MTWHKRLVLGVIAVIALALVTGTLLFKEHHTLTFAEGNKLHTLTAFEAHGVAAELLARATSEDDLSVFARLPGERDITTAQAVATTDAAQLPISTYMGRLPRPDESGVALVGSHVATTVDHAGRETVTYQGNTYPVIGRLGRTPESQQRNSALVFDRGLFTSSPQPLILDGSYAATAFARTYPNRQRRAAPLTLRVSSGTYSVPMLAAVGITGLVTLAAWGIIASRMFIHHGRKLSRGGRSYSSVLTRFFTEIATILGAAALFLAIALMAVFGTDGIPADLAPMWGLAGLVAAGLGMADCSRRICQSSPGKHVRLAWPQQFPSRGRTAH
ncbi:hypothetical protein [Dermatophilus congolensis]|uniref:hypothetical protein n=1 Tax=Dermatophilus congolensis TaxID=1863 RepID=UPI001AAEF831|nr:hypothetical protein [Dermatophilus congolensis]MBO3128578.1 hypothetical protein [Dermatophilus congolensis]MBO3132785.1 hypothetical protein [Dermatophilus congolensis]MBO3133056.1 hypothetical protein [Dermatophilus congolensis]MBO3135288.1 hypothetical protein [Dermatophilus congolensis]MBO3137531.1 hypothetical protein [Dermatophilus congolensis]